MSIVNAIIFDLDGVLVNTIEMHYQAWRKVAQSGGRDLTYTEMEALRGVRRNECLEILFPETPLTPQKVDSFLHIKHTTYVEALTQQPPDNVLMDNALTLIHTARDMGLKLGIASSSVNAMRVLEHVGIVPLFDVIADGNTVARSKPEPDIFVWAAGALGVYPQHALVFEDSLAGIQAANQAGMHTVGVFNPETQSHAHHYYANLVEIQLNTLLENIDQTFTPSHSTSPIGDTNARN